MECKDKIMGDIAIVYLEGRMIGRPDSDKLHREIQCLLKKDIHKIVVDLHRIDWMGSMGVGALIRDLISVRNVGGDLRLAQLTSKLKSLFKITKLASIILIFETVDQAVKSFELN